MDGNRLGQRRRLMDSMFLQRSFDDTLLYGGLFHSLVSPSMNFFCCSATNVACRFFNLKKQDENEDSRKVKRIASDKVVGGMHAHWHQ